MNKGTTICRLTRTFPMGKAMKHGLDPGLFFISKEQVNLGNKVYIIASKVRNYPNYEITDGIVVHRVSTPYNLNIFAKIKEIDQKDNIDVIHAHGTSGILYSFLGNLIFKKLFVVHVHLTTATGLMRGLVELPVSLISRYKILFRLYIYLLRQKLMWKRADLLIAVSNSVANDLSTYYDIPKDKIRVVYNGVDTNTFRNIKDFEALKKQLGLSEKRVVLFIGTIRPVKGLHYLVKAIPDVIKVVPNSFFLMIGGTPKWMPSQASYKPELERIINRLKISKYVKLMEPVSHQELPHFYSMADLVVLPSSYEASPKVILEAASCEKPVVASNIGGIPEYVKHGETGILVPPRNPEKLSEAILELLTDPKKSRTMGKKGRKRVLDNFSWKLAAEKIHEAYEEFL